MRSVWSPIETHRPLFFDPYRRNRATGAFILIDPVSNLTVAAGMISERVDARRSQAQVRLDGCRIRTQPLDRRQSAGSAPDIGPSRSG